VTRVSDAHLRRLPSPGASRAVLQRHLDAARETGVSYDGALILSVLAA
jgi:hypothetical protein